MRIALHNPFQETWFAESELARRIGLAAQTLGWEAQEVRSATEIQAFQPDCVLALHNNAPKLTEFPTYGCMWNPPVFFEQVEGAIANILTYDGYLVASPTIEQWLHRLLLQTPKPFLKAPFYTSSPATPYQAPDLAVPQLFYCGSNWDGQRFQALFQALDAQPYTTIYGNPQGWSYLRQSYRGALPFDGSSVLKTLQQAGVGLCLHRPEHRQAGVPSMRIFEIVAAGSVAICSDHPFIRQAFGETVLYLEAEASATEQARQIDHHMAWISAHPERAIALSQAAHQRFTAHYTLETLLQNLETLHQEVLPEKQFTAHGHWQMEGEPSVQVVMLGMQQSEAEIGRSLLSLSRQTYPNLSVLLVQTEGAAEPSAWHHTDVSINRLPLPDGLPLSSILRKSAAAVQSDYVGFLEAGDTLHPNHIGLLVQCLRQNSHAGMAYSASLCPEAKSVQSVTPIRPFSLERLLRLDPLIAPSSVLMRQSCVAEILGKEQADPQLQEAGWLYLWLCLVLKTAVLFNYEVTVTRAIPLAPLPDNQQKALRLIFWHQEFAPGLSLQSSQGLSGTSAELTGSLHEAQARIAAMETSKFWQLRTAWFSLKRRLGLPITDS